MDVSPLMNTTAAKAEAASQYIASFSELLVMKKETHNLDDAYGAAAGDRNKAQMELRDYFNKNIIHKGIVFDTPEWKGWFAIPLVRGEIKAFIRSESEIVLIRNFMERRKKNIDALAEDYIGRKEITVRANEAILKHSSQLNYGVAAVLTGSFNTGLVGLRQKIEYIVYLQNILDREKQMNPGISGALSGSEI